MTMQATSPRSHAEAVGFAHIDVDTAECVHSIEIDDRNWVEVLGHPERGVYEYIEWSTDRQGDPVQMDASNAGYSSIAHALRDGLIAATL